MNKKCAFWWEIDDFGEKCTILIKEIGGEKLAKNTTMKYAFDGKHHTLSITLCGEHRMEKISKMTFRLNC